MNNLLDKLALFKVRQQKKTSRKNLEKSLEKLKPYFEGKDIFNIDDFDEVINDAEANHWLNQSANNIIAYMKLHL